MRLRIREFSEVEIWGCGSSLISSHSSPKQRKMSIGGDISGKVCDSAVCQQMRQQHMSFSSDCYTLSDFQS